MMGSEKETATSQVGVDADHESDGGTNTRTAIARGC